MLVTQSPPLSQEGRRAFDVWNKQVGRNYLVQGMAARERIEGGNQPVEWNDANDSPKDECHPCVALAEMRLGDVNHYESGNYKK